MDVVEIATMVKMIPWWVTPQIPRAGLQLPEQFSESRRQQMFLLIDEQIQESDDEHKPELQVPEYH